VFSLLFKNWRIKLLSLAIAGAMWVFVMGQDKAELTVEVPVELSSIPADMVVVGEVLNKVQARLTGPATLVRRATTERLVKRVDLSGMGPGEHVFQVLPDELELPSGVRALRVSPARFTVTLAVQRSREVPVRPVLRGEPAEGWEVAEVVFTPPKVKISGAASELEAVDWVWTAPLDVAGLKKGGTVAAAVRAPRGRSLQLEPTEVEAEIRLREVQPPQPEPGGGQ
jgi:YbbR domain-containing protein